MSLEFIIDKQKIPLIIQVDKINNLTWYNLTRKEIILKI